MLSKVVSHLWRASISTDGVDRTMMAFSQYSTRNHSLRHEKSDEMPSCRHFGTVGVVLCSLRLCHVCYCEHAFRVLYCNATCHVQCIIYQRFQSERLNDTSWQKVDSLAGDLACFLICQQKYSRHGNAGRDNPFGNGISTLDFSEEEDTP